jgi:hypothetical protein
MYPIQFQPASFSSTSLGVYSEAKTISNRKSIRQLFTYTELTVSYTQIPFSNPNWFHGYTKLNENIVQYFPPN